MIPTAAEVLKIAASQIGYKEKKSNKDLDSFTANAGSGNYTKYARDLYKAGYWNGNKNGYDWCTSFVAWCIWKACGENIADAKKVQPYGTYGASCKWETKYYKDAKRWSATPQVGDQAFFTRGHTGLVEKFDGNKLTLIEGNSNNQVERRTYNFPNAIFSGFGRPFYKAEEPKKEEPKPTVVKDTKVPYNAKVVPTNGLNVRTGAGTSYKKLGALKCGTTVKVLEEKSGWGRILFNGKAGWISLNYTRKVA